MLQLIELFDQLAQSAATPLLIALAFSSGVVAVIRNWRITLPMMVVVYVAAGILLARVIDPSIALLKPLAGAIVCFALSITAQRADALRAERGESIARERLAQPNWRYLPAQILMRAMAALLVLTAAFGAAIRFPLPGTARELDLGAYILIGFGLLVVATAHESLSVGLGLFILLLGFELAYTPLEPSIGVSALLGLTTLLVGAAVSYLTLADVGVAEAELEAGH